MGKLEYLGVSPETEGVIGMLGLIGVYQIVMICSHYYIRKLNEGVQKLERAKQRVQHYIDYGQRYGKLIETDVKQWMKDEEAAAKRARRTLAQYEAAKNNCLYGWFPNPFECFCLGADAWSSVQVIQALLLDNLLDRVYYEKRPPGLVGGATDLNSLADHGGNIILHGSSRRTITSWRKGRRLGSGSSGTVYEGLADFHCGRFLIAIKEVPSSDQGRRGEQRLLQLEREISLLSRLEHENIVRYFGTDEDHENLYIFLELMTGGSLATLYKKNDWRDSNVPAYTRDILNGLKYLHDRDVVHRDIKCANILVDASGSVKLADFGLGKATDISDAKSSIGTFRWMAPEVVNTQNISYGPAADIWSLGATVLEMLTRQHPYPGLEGVAAAYQTGLGIPPPVPDNISGDARDFILKCLQVDQDKRPSAAELLERAFVRNPPT